MADVAQLSLIVPAYNEALRFSNFTEALLPTLQELQKSGILIELIVVEDGSSASEISAVQKDLERFSFFVETKHLVQPENQGKGAAIERGLREAKYEFIAFMDADASTAAESFEEMLRDFFAQNWDVSVASRVMMLGKNIQRSFWKHYFGRVFATYVSLLFQFPIYDSQCGCKIFRKSLILPLLDVVIDRRWVWDTQLLILCFKRKYRMREYPVSWVDVRASKVNYFVDAIGMFMAMTIFAIKKPWKRAQA